MDKNVEAPVPFGKALEQLINSYSIENGSNTPDFILAEYMIGCLRAYQTAVGARDKWFGKEDDYSIDPKFMDAKPQDPHMGTAI